jgi:hypothetical protein
MITHYDCANIDLSNTLLGSGISLRSVENGFRARCGYGTIVRSSNNSLCSNGNCCRIVVAAIRFS